jgi:hypothetical protein
VERFEGEVVTEELNSSVPIIGKTKCGELLSIAKERLVRDYTILHQQHALYRTSPTLHTLERTSTLNNSHLKNMVK